MVPRLDAAGSAYLIKVTSGDDSWPVGAQLGGGVTLIKLYSFNSETLII